MGNEVVTDIISAVQSQDTGRGMALAQDTGDLVRDSEVLVRRLEGRDREMALRGEGLERRLLYQTIVGGLQAVTVLYNRDGVKIGEVPDHNVRAKFISSAIEVLGEKAEKEGGSRLPQVVVVLTDGRRV